MEERKGLLCVFCAAVLYSIGGLCIKVIPWNGMSINGARTAIALVVIGGYLLAARHPLRFNRWILVGALCVFGTNALFSLANKLTTAAQRHCPAIHGPHLCHSGVGAVLAEAAPKAGCGRLCGGAGGRAVLFCRQPEPGGRPGQRPGPDLRDLLRPGCS